MYPRRTASSVSVAHQHLLPHGPGSILQRRRQGNPWDFPMTDKFILPARKPAQRFCVFWVAWRYSKKRKCAYCHGWCIGTWLWCVSIPLRTIPKCCFVEAKTIFHMFQWLENRPYFWTCFVFSMGKCTCFRTISSTQLAQLLRSACTHLMTSIHKTPLPCFAVRLDHRMTTSQAIGNHPFAGFPTPMVPV